jgi:hypothetical protein
VGSPALVLFDPAVALFAGEMVSRKEKWNKNKLNNQRWNNDQREANNEKMKATRRTSNPTPTDF